MNGTNPESPNTRAGIGDDLMCFKSLNIVKAFVSLSSKKLLVLLMLLDVSDCRFL